MKPGCHPRESSQGTINATVPGAMIKKSADPIAAALRRIQPPRNRRADGAPGETRTPANPLRRRVLYPSELRARAYVFLHVIENLALFDASAFGSDTLICAHS